MLPAHDTPAFRELLHQQVEKRRNPCKQKAILGEKSVFSPILRLHQHHRPQDTILIRVQT